MWEYDPSAASSIASRNVPRLSKSTWTLSPTRRSQIASMCIERHARLRCGVGELRSAPTMRIGGSTLNFRRRGR